MKILPLPGVAPLGKLEIDVGVLAVIGVAAGPDDEEHGVRWGAILKAMTVADAGLEAGALAGTDGNLALVGDENELTLEDVNEFVLLGMPVTLARPSSRG